MESAPGVDQESRVQWRPLDLAAFVAFFIGTILFLPGVLFLVFRFFQPELEITTLSGVQQILMQAVMNSMQVGFIVFLIAKVHRQPVLKTLRLLPNRGLSVGRLVLAGAVLAIVMVAATSFFQAPADTPLEQLLSTTAALVLFVIFGIAVAPLLEEIVFRGFIFTVLADLCGARAAIVITTVSFAALHVLQVGGYWPAVIVIMIVSYIFTAVRYRKDSTLASAIMHTAYNAMIFAASGLASLLGLTAS